MNENPIAAFLVLMYVFATAIALVVMLIFYPPTPKAYPCALAEISPDIPISVKTQCRESSRKNRPSPE
jgi:hypothetical protein